MNDSYGAITWGLVVFGWIATHFLTKKREQRKEVRSKLDDIRSKLSTLEIDVTSFHTANEYSAEKARAILLNIQRAYRDIEREPKLKENTSRFRFDFRRAATLSNFDKSSFFAIENDSDFFDKLAASHDKLTNQLEQNYIIFYRDSLL